MKLLGYIFISILLAVAITVVVWLAYLGLDFIVTTSGVGAAFLSLLFVFFSVMFIFVSVDIYRKRK